MERKTTQIVNVMIVAVITTSFITVGIKTYSIQPSLIVTGSLYFNDSGDSHGGFEAAMQWNVTLTVKADFGFLIVTPEPGYMNNDRLLKWSYGVVGFQITEEQIIMAIYGHPVALQFVENDTIWNKYHNQYIGFTPDLSPTIFPGFLDYYYVELRLSAN